MESEKTSKVNFQRVEKIIPLLTFIFAIAYALLIIAKYSFWFVVNPYNRYALAYLTFIMQLVYQSLLALSTFFAHKQRYKTSLFLALLPLLVYSVLLIAPNSAIKGFFADVSNIDKAIHLASFIMVISLFVLTVATIITSLLNIVRTKKI